MLTGMHREIVLIHFVFILALFALSLAHPAAHAQTPMKITLASPGPASFSYLPVELIKKIGADRAEGVDLEIRYYGGGPLAAKDMLNGDSDFAALGMSALATFHAEGKDVRSIVSVSRAPTYVLSVRSDLRKEVKTIADLRGRVIGVHSGARNNTSTARHMLEYLLLQAGVTPDSVNYLSAGQNQQEQHAALASGTIDALMGGEPFTSRFRDQGMVFVLADLHQLDVAKRALGGPFLYVQIATRGNLLLMHPEKVRRMTAIMRRTLQWIASRSPDQVASLIAGDDAVRQRELQQLLARGKTAFSPDGVFRRAEVATTERFYRTVHGNDPRGRNMRLGDLIDARYAGWRE
jgi:NitT/TauT family transport system substrate-binding protein